MQTVKFKVDDQYRLEDMVKLFSENGNFVRITEDGQLEVEANIPHIKFGTEGIVINHIYTQNDDKDSVKKFYESIANEIKIRKGAH